MRKILRSEIKIKWLDFKIQSLINFKINYSRKLKRSLQVVAKNNLYVEYLAVIESGTYKYFQSVYGTNIPTSLINDYINIYFTQLINGVTISN